MINLLVLAEERAEADAEPAPWRSHDIVQFADDAEHLPTSQAQLFALALARLDDLKLDLEEENQTRGFPVAKGRG